MDKLKYIIVDNNGLETPIIFPVILGHTEVKTPKKVISGGFVYIYIKDNNIQVNCFGESITLKVKSREIDSKIIKKLL